MNSHLRRTNITVVVAMLLATLLFAIPGLAQIVQNPSFEQVQIGPPYQTNIPVDIPGWTHTGAQGDDLLWAVGAINGLVSVAGAGNQFVTLGGGIAGPGTASWTTRITGLSPGNNYMLGFKIANEGEAPSQTMTASLRCSAPYWQLERLPQHVDLDRIIGSAGSRRLSALLRLGGSQLLPSL